MIRPKSVAGVALLDLPGADAAGATCSTSPSGPGGAAQQDDDRNALYQADKGADVSPYKLCKGYTLWLRHRTAALLQLPGRLGGRAAQTPPPPLLLLLLAAAAALAAAALLLRAAAPRRHSTQHLVILDAGSTGTRVHVFRYRTPPGAAYPLLHLPEAKLKLEPGLSSFADDPAAAAAPLQQLTRFAAEHVPSDEWAATPVHLMATAGLRLLGPEQAEALLQQCREVLERSPFRFDRAWVNVITGQQEALFGWVAANYAAGGLQEAARHVGSRRDRPDTRLLHGLLELGGASAQVTLLPDTWLAPGQPHSLRVRLPGLEAALYCHSFLGYGFDVLEQRAAALQAEQASTLPGGGAAADPCLPVGFTGDQGQRGGGDWALCQRRVQQLMDPAFCRAHAAANSSECPELPYALPSLHGRLMAIENFHWTAAALQLPAHASVSELTSAAAAFCGRPWSETLAAHLGQQGDPHHLHRYCYGAAVVVTLLRDVLRVPPHLKLHFTNTWVRGDGSAVGLDWALGAAVVQLTTQRGGGGGGAWWLLPPRPLLLLLVVVVGSGALLAGAACVHRWHAARTSTACEGPAAAGKK